MLRAIKIRLYPNGTITNVNDLLEFIKSQKEDLLFTK